MTAPPTAARLRRRVVWFVALWAGGVLAVAALAGLLRLGIRAVGAG